MCGKEAFFTLSLDEGGRKEDASTWGDLIGWDCAGKGCTFTDGESSPAVNVRC